MSHEDDPEIAEDVIAGREPGTAVLRGQGRAVAVVAAGGALGALARWGIGLAWPAPHGSFPTATLLINVVGCLLMGVLVVHVAEVREAHPLVRPFLGVGVLGGFTTFSTFAVDTQQLLVGGHLGVALGYLAATVLGSVGAAALGLTLARTTARGGRR
ncbi:fluoride efflux transporter CrcB [Actinomycetospora endophytica]|uniref:Fluoride-specific ion channel FluC n=1 Tax=Actinomycetospora endophytica TaxID=2291215 RepID=A0ABS8P394_9PSEU|nr:fluoride efflux transporter CrcB [Actinomycetospora endophytica]MCD2192722.1 fluoride efflux transporter CrcB [Actinomycetospora endophytica]